MNRSSLIRTVPRRGYTFDAKVTTSPAEFRRPTPVTEVIASPLPLPLPTIERRNTSKIAGIVFGFVALVALALLVLLNRRPVTADPTYTQITNFTDSAISPAISPDGRMVAFLRSSNWFFTPDEIYVRMLPSGESVQLTHDSRPKYGLAFSPDGTRIAYTVAGKRGWTTVIVSVLGGESSELLTNAAGLTWLDEHRILFSEVKTGQHMGVVTATETGPSTEQSTFPRTNVAWHTCPMPRRTGSGHWS
jgi:hypothetical protein